MPDGIHVGVLLDHVSRRKRSEFPETIDIPDGSAPDRELKKGLTMSVGDIVSIVPRAESVSQTFLHQLPSAIFEWIIYSVQKIPPCERDLCLGTLLQ